MAKHCIACKRDIAEGQQECYICGSSQSYTRYYLKGGSIFLLLLGVTLWFSYQFFEKEAKQQAVNYELHAQSKLNDATDRIERLKLQLEKARQETQLAQVSTVQNSENAVEEKLKLKQMELRATKAEERASWLSKENRRFKVKVKELTDKLLAAKSVSLVSKPSPNTANPKLISLKQELVGYESQKQTLKNNIASKKKQLESSWQPMIGNDVAPPSAETVTQRAKQIEQATSNETSQVLVLNGQIEAVKKKILDIEGG